MISRFINKKYLEALDIYETEFPGDKLTDFASILEAMIEIEELLAQFPVLLEDRLHLYRLNLDLQLRSQALWGLPQYGSDPALVSSHLDKVRPYFTILKSHKAFMVPDHLEPELIEYSLNSDLPHIGWIPHQYAVDTVIRHDILWSRGDLGGGSDPSFEITLCDYSAVKNRLQFSVPRMPSGQGSEFGPLDASDFGDWVVCISQSSEFAQCKMLLSAGLSAGVREELEFMRQRQKQVCGEGLHNLMIFSDESSL